MLGDVEPIASSVVTIEFADQRMSGSAGCNSYGAGYETDGDRLIFDAVAMTEMACADELVMQQEGKFTDLLGQVETYKLTKTELEFMDVDGKILMSFIPRS
jgi:heat shock protein HslJ